MVSLATTPARWTSSWELACLSSADVCRAWMALSLRMARQATQGCSGLLLNCLFHFNWKLMVLGLRRVNIIWKLPRNYSGFILELLEIDSGSFSNQKVNILNMFLYINSKHEEKSKSDFQISTSSNESRPGTPFKMCSRSRQYQRFEYHQKLLTWTRSYAISKSTYLIFVLFGFDTNCNECRERIS